MGALLQQKFVFFHRAEKRIGASSECIKERKETVSALVAFWHYFLFYFAFPPSLYSIKSEIN